MDIEAPPIVPGRSCAGCTMCCKVLSIPELEKPSQVWCKNCAIGAGCNIYAARPPVCQNFFCLYLTDPNMSEHWRPARSGIVVTYDAPHHRLLIAIDQDQPDVWKAEPLYSEIKAWSRAASTDGGQVLIVKGPNVTAILPDRDIALGDVRPDQFILTTQDQTPNGLVYGAALVEAGDPRLAKR